MDELEVNTDHALEWHLTNNFYPPPGARMIALCAKAIDACNCGFPNWEIINKNGLVKTAAQIVGDWRLEYFVD